jgi:DNA-binding Lrp family transcriptional regulator
MDHIDKKMLIALWANCRVSFRKLGSYLGMTGASTKKRVDRLVKSGAIHDFYVVLGEAMLDMKRALVFVRTTPSVSVHNFSIALTKHRGIFRILSLLNGNFLLVVMYPEQEGHLEMESYIRSLGDVKEVEFYPIYRSENCILKGRKVELSKIQRRVLSCLVSDARIPASEISKKLGLSSRRVETVLEQLQKERGVIFSLRWKPNLGKGLAFILKIIYEKTKIDVMPFNIEIAKNFPEFWYSHLPEEKPVIFSIFLVESVTDVHRISESMKEMDYVQSVETLIYSSALVSDPPTRVQLIELLQHDGILENYHQKEPLETDLVV